MGGKNSKKSYNVETVDSSPKASINKSTAPRSSSTPVATPTPVAAPEPAPIVVNSEPVPQWINETHFVNVLSANVAEFSKIKSFSMKPALSAGENYATLMLRVSIEVELNDNSSKEVCFMLKVPHDMPEMEQLLQLSNFFNIENTAYMDIVPKLEALYKDKGLDITFAPRAYRFNNSEPKLHNTVLMEDLGTSGFKNINRLNCLNLEQSKLALRKLAQYHAATAHYVTVHGPYEGTFVTGMFKRDDPRAIAMIEAMMGTFQKLFLANLKTYNYGEEVYNKLVKYFSNMSAEYLLMADHNPSEFNVLNHGDCWMNNLLFKHEPAGEISDMYFVDFQNPKYGSPVQDLLYFIMTSVHIDYKLNDFEYLIRYYHDNLVEHLQLLAYPEKIPHLRDLHMQLYKYGTWALSGAIIVLPLVLLDSNEKSTFENFMGSNTEGEQFKNLMYTGERYRKYIGEILPWLDNRGLLDTYTFTPAAKPIQEIKESTFTPAAKPIQEIKESTFTPAAMPIQEIKESTFTPAAKPIQEIKESTFTPTAMPIQEIKESIPETPKKLPELPEWLEFQDFSDIIAAADSKFDKVLDGTISLATKAGDNYASKLLKIDVNAQLKDNSTKTFCYILKLLPNIELEITAFNLFPKEKKVYETLIPGFEQLYKDAGLPVTFSAKSYRFSKEISEEYILLENIQPLGFKMCDRMHGLDLEHTKCVLKKLAQWHAVSLRYKELNGAYDQLFANGIFREETREFFRNMLGSFTKPYFDSVKKFEGVDECISKLEAVWSAHTDRVIADGKIDENEFNVLNHGDLWINNIMFQYDSAGNIQETYLLDHQVTKYGNPAQDLYYFLFTSTQLDIKVDQFDYLIRCYHEYLVEHAKLLKYTGFVPSLKEMHVILLKHPVFAVGTVASTLTICLAEPTENLSMDTFTTDNDAAMAVLVKMYDNVRYKAHFERVMPWLNRRGLLDF